MAKQPQPKPSGKPTTEQDEFAKFASQALVGAGDGVPTTLVRPLIDRPSLDPADVNPPGGEQSTEGGKPTPPSAAPVIPQHSPMSYLAGRELPVKAKEGVDPLLVESYKLMRSLMIGGLIMVWSPLVRYEVETHMEKLQKAVEG